MLRELRQVMGPVSASSMSENGKSPVGATYQAALSAKQKYCLLAARFSVVKGFMNLPSRKFDLDNVCAQTNRLNWGHLWL